MNIITDETQYDGRGAVLALGMFDGVHLGHRALIARAKALAGELGADLMVCTFDRHPTSVLCPKQEPEPLTNAETRLRIFEKLGADWALVKPFTKELADREAGEYARALIFATRAKGLVCGENYTFGKGGQGSAALLRRIAAEQGVRMEIAPSVTDEGEVVSSTLIRALLRQGETERAHRLFGAKESEDTVKQG